MIRMNTVKADNVDSPSNKSDSVLQPGLARTLLVAYGDDEEEEEQLDESSPFARSITPSLPEIVPSTSSLPITGPVAALRVNLNL